MSVIIWNKTVERPESNTVNGGYYRYLDARTFSLNGDWRLVYSLTKRASALVPNNLFKLLSSCRNFATIEQHAHNLRSKLDSNKLELESITDSLLKAAEVGLLVSNLEIQSKLKTAEGPSVGTQKITAVGLPTCNRVESLGRALHSYIENTKAYGRSTKFIISDGSQTALVRDLNRAMLQALKRKYGVEISYAGQEERATFAEKLIRRGEVPSEVVEFSLSNADGFPAAYGVTRNALLLDALGELFLQVDDDTVCNIAAVPETSDGIVFTSKCDPTELWFFPDHETAMNSVDFVKRDFLALHESLLGRNLADCVSLFAPDGESDVTNVGSTFLHQLNDDYARVRVTFAGLIGDSGIGVGRGGSYIFLDGPSLKRLTESEEKYRSGLASRQILRAVTRTTVSDGDWCMGGNIGLDNRELLPAFMPVQRGEDALFGAIVRNCFKGNFFGFVPWALLHAPPSTLSLPSSPVWEEIASPRTNDVIEVIISSFKNIPGGGDGRKKLEALGRHLVDLATMSPKDFQEVVKILLWHAVSRRLTLLEQRLQKYKDEATFWAYDVTKFMEVDRSILVNDSYGAPRDLAVLYGGDLAWRLLQSLLLKFGQLVQYWPEIVKGATKLRGEGERLAQPI
jgi:hypothetical protein